MHGLVSHCRIVCRRLARQPLLTAVAVAAMAVGIALPTGAFVVVRALAFSELPAPEGRGVVMVRDYHRTGGYDVWITAAELARRAEALTAFAGLAGYHVRSLPVGEGEATEVVSTAYLTVGALELLGVRPRLGRSFVDDDAARGAPPVALVGDAFWRARLGEDPRVLERPLRIGGEPVRVVGVLPPGLVFPTGEQLAEPVAVMRGLGTVFLGAGSLALLFAVASLYALMSCAVVARRREIGIRLTVGATGRNVLATILGRGLRQMALGGALGLLLALALGRLVRLIPFEIGGSGVAPLAALSLLLLVAGLAAAAGPARRALTTDPIAALEEE